MPELEETLTDIKIEPLFYKNLGRHPKCWSSGRFLPPDVEDLSSAERLYVHSNIYSSVGWSDIWQSGGPV